MPQSSALVVLAGRAFDEHIVQFASQPSADGQLCESFNAMVGGSDEVQHLCDHRAPGIQVSAGLLSIAAHWLGAVWVSESMVRTPS